MCHESVGRRARSRRSGSARAASRSRTSSRADLLVVVGQNPGTNHPRMLSVAGDGQARAARRSSAINPLREAGLGALRQPADAHGACSAAARSSPTCTCRSASTATSRCSRRVNRLLLDRDAVDHAFVGRALRRPRRAARAPGRARLGRSSTAPPGCRASRSRRSPTLVERLAAHDRLLGDGAHAAPQLRRDDPRDRQLPAAARDDRQAGRRASARCAGTPTCRATARWASGSGRPTRSWTGWRRRSGSRCRASTALDVVEAIEAMRDGRVKVFMAMGGNFLSRRAGHGGDRRGAAARARLTVHVATKPNRSHVTPGAQALLLPTLGPHRARRPRRARAARHRRGLDERRARLARAARARVATQLRSEVRDRLRARRSACSATACRCRGRRWADDYDAIRDAIARAIPGFEDFNARLRRRLRPAPPAARRADASRRRPAGRS